MHFVHQSSLRFEKDQVCTEEASLLVEEPLQILINGAPFSITMRTPGDDAFLVKGLLISEGIAQPEGLEGPVLTEQKEGYTEARVSIPEIFLCAEVLEKRSLISNSSCGFCGKQSITDLNLEGTPHLHSARLSAEIIPHLGQAMRQHQQAFNSTGGSHAAALFTAHGDFIRLFEDIGRHNAVDKAIGFLASEHLRGEQMVLFVSGRVSFEIVSKASAARIPFICAVSAVSSLAVKIAEQRGITLIGFCRDERFTVYSNPHSINSLVLSE